MIEVRKNKREVIRISRDKYNGHDLVNLRVFYDAGEGDMRPGKQGMAFKAEMLPVVLDAMRTLGGIDCDLPGGG